MAEPSPYQRQAYEYARDRIGRPTRTIAHQNAAGTIAVPVAEVDASPEAGLTSYYTIGLGQYDSQLVSEKGRLLRFEFVLAARADFSFAAAGLANCALNLASGDFTAKPGMIYPNVFADYSKDASAIHGLLWYPFVWQRTFDGAVIDGADVEWLQILPITADERKWAIDHGAGFKGAGIEALIDAFEAQSTDIFDLSRASAALAR